MRKAIWTAEKLLVAAAICAACAPDDEPAERVELVPPVSASRFEPVEPPGDGFSQESSAATADRLCASCATNADCGAGNYCIRRSDGVRFCGRDCRTSPCPTGYSCTQLASTVSQCVPPQGDCRRVTSPSDAGTQPRDAGVVPDAGTLTGDVPSGTHCAPVASWSATWSGYEGEVLRLSNVQRSRGATCGTTAYPPVPPLTMSPSLRCAARLHSKDMGDRGYFSHTTQGSGETFDERIDAAGYGWRNIGENIAKGYASPQAVVDGWMKSPGHCQNIMSRSFTQIGVGYYTGNVWTQDFGAPL